MNYANRGLNFWCIDEQYLTLEQGKIKYTLPAGTTDVLEVNYRTVTETTGTDTSDATSFVRQFSASTKTTLIRIDSSTSGTITISYSTDGITYTTHSTISHDGTNKWYTIDPTIEDVYLKLSVSTGTLTVTELITASAYKDVPLYRMNRDEYMGLPDKSAQGIPYQFWLDRQLTPIMHLWNCPNSAATDNTIHIFRHHQVEDVGSLTEILDIPNRWLEATIWQLAKNLAIELPNTPPDRVKMCIEMASNAIFEAELEERDNSTVSIAPDIGVYT